MDARRKKDIKSFQKRHEQSEAEPIEVNDKVEILEEFADAENPSKDEDMECQEEEEGDTRKKRKDDPEGSKENTEALPEGYMPYELEVQI